MTTAIFKSVAEKYWAAGLQVIPLYSMSKRPKMNDWSQYGEKKVTEEDKADWLALPDNTNIGLVCGPASGVMVIDIDTDEPKLYKAITELLPFSPWERKGRKGLMLAYKFNGTKTFRVKNQSGETLVECLSTRTQCVLPPSIHPDTKLPYESNTNLYDVVNSLQTLPENIEELLRHALAAAGADLSHAGWTKVTDFVSAGSRDTTLTEMAGLLAYAVVRGERSLKESIGMLRAYHSQFIEHTAGDLMDVEKHVSNLIKFLERDVKEKGKILPHGWDAELSSFEKETLGVTLGKDDTQWSAGEILEYLHDQFENVLQRAERNAAVEAVLSRLARSPKITRIEEDQILRYIVEVSGMGIPLTSFRIRLKELKLGDVVGQDHSEIARAVVKDLEELHLIRFVGSRFMKWGGSHWTELASSFISNHISSNYGHLPACKKNADIAGILKVVSFLCEQEITKEKIKGVNFANGFLTEELRLMPHNPDYGMTYTLPFRYVPEVAGKFPMFEDFMKTSWGRDNDYQSKMAALQEAMCVTLFGMGSRFQKAILLHGAPRSGKTQLLRIIQSLVPVEGRCSVAPEVWADKFLPTVMYRKILNVCGELSEKKINGQVFKDIIDGSERPAQFKNQQVFQMTPELIHWFASNHLPKTDDTSSGFIRRWLMLTFHYPVPEKDTKLDLGDLISAQEREAITAWAVLALPRLRERNRYTLPPSHVMLCSEFANINNSVRMFIYESGKVHTGVPDGFTTENKAYNAYWSWCSSAGGNKAVALPKFRAMMRELTNERDFTVVVSQTANGGTEMLLRGLTVTA